MKELAGGTNVWHSNHENTGIPTKPEVRKQNAPSLKVKFIEPMKARLTETLPEGDWIYEIKLDGFRAIALKQSDYLDTLKRHGVAHVFNSWGGYAACQRATRASRQRHESRIRGRAVLAQARPQISGSVDLFSAYDKIKEPYEEGRAAAAELINQVMLKQLIRKLFLYVTLCVWGIAA